MSNSSASDSTPVALVLHLQNADIVMTAVASAIACGDEDPILLQNPN
jgi:hypothetical protein